jgi:hypothetical protein
MSKIININSKNQEINLEVGTYKIFLLGGFGITLNNFSISLISIKTNEKIESKKAIWPVQTYVNGKRAKKILTININHSGQYKIVFNNPESIIVKKSNLKFNIFSNETLLNENLEIVITLKIGLFPISAL